jgi:hypothetical protein
MVSSSAHVARREAAPFRLHQIGADPMRHSDALFSVAVLFIVVSLYVYFTFLPTSNHPNQTIAYLSLVCIMLLSLSLYAGLVGVIVAIRWGRHSAAGEDDRAEKSHGSA